MELSPLHVLSCDVLIIGGGGAGLRAAIEARESGAEVIVVSKTRAGYGNNTMISKATFASASGWADPRDDPEVLIRDTIVGGRFINDRKLVAAVARGSGAQTAFLEKCGVRFIKHQGSIRAIHAPGHSYPRHVRVERQSGRGLTLPLREYATGKGVRFADRVFITRLFASREGRIAAASGFDQEGRFFAFQGSCFVLATGGFGQAYFHTNNAPGITGDGQALAYELGIPLKDMEFVQFYPTASGNAWTRIILYEDLLLGDKAVLRNADGDDILAGHGLDNPMAMTRDRLTRAIMEEISRGKGVSGGVIMDLSGASEQHVLQYQSLFRDPARKAFIVSPTTHFCSGGIMINEDAETQMPGLFAAGEVCGGVHGANRIAGNALSEVFVMGGIAGRKASLKAREMGRPELPEREIAAEKVRLESPLSGGNRPPRELQRTVKELMWYMAGITRDEKGLVKALDQIEESHSHIREIQVNGFGDLMKSLELQNMLILAEMVCRAALLRTESRGGHYRRDYPEENADNWLRNIVISKQDSGMSLQDVPVSMDLKKGNEGG
jgi:succinate dehydrogenase/fumarate reductase flavoprotein subunit